MGEYSKAAQIMAFGSGGRTFCTICFWAWGIGGLVLNTGAYLALSGSVGVGTSTYMALGLLFWIGGMMLFGLGAVISGLDYNFERPV